MSIKKYKQKSKKSDQFFGSSVIITGPVKFIGPPEQDPENDVAFQFWQSAYRRVFEDLKKECPLENNQKTKDLPPKNNQKS